MTSSPPDNNHLRAEEPFDDIQSSDTILRTSDGVNFYIHRIILILGSPFFRDMFSLPQPASIDTEKPIIDITENSKTLDSLLRLCTQY
ncbi:hypothetical protein BDQ17DRAFT_1460362 [Cyathus striatus]|nr:hypothetical protein BDQ17DRAFT_1460362 [Cyathus striatus]